MPRRRTKRVLLGALAAALSLSLSGPAWGAETCPPAGYSHGGIRPLTRVSGLRAVLTPVEAPVVTSGRVTAWVGVGRAGSGSRPGALRAGLLAGPGQSNRLYYEVFRRGTWQVFVGPEVPAGTAHRIALVRIRGSLHRWRVWIDGRPVSKAYRLPGSRTLKSGLATVETLSQTPTECSSFLYRFSHVSLAEGGAWRRLARGRIISDTGYTILRDGRDAFRALSRKKPKPTPPPPAPAPDSGTAPTADGGTAPAPAPVPSVFVGDWETGDLSQWSGIQHNQSAPVSAQFEVVSNPLAQGLLAAKFTVRPGDKFGTSSGERSEVAWFGSDEGPGDDYWYAWSTLFPTTWTEPSGWGIILQWHSGYPGVPPLVLNARGDTLLADFNAGVVDSRGHGAYGNIHTILSSLPKGSWNDFVVHVRWEGTATGSFQVWHRVRGQTPFQLKLDLQGIPTLQVVNGATYENYLKTGLYRNADPVRTDFLYHDGFHRGSTVAAVGRAFGSDAGFSELAASLS